MHAVTLEGRGDLAEWRDAARALAMAGVAADRVDWRIAGAASLFDGAAPLPPATRPPPRFNEQPAQPGEQAQKQEQAMRVDGKFANIK